MARCDGTYTQSQTAPTPGCYSILGDARTVGVCGGTEVSQTKSLCESVCWLSGTNASNYGDLGLCAEHVGRGEDPEPRACYWIASPGGTTTTTHSCSALSQSQCGSGQYASCTWIPGSGGIAVLSEDNTTGTSSGSQTSTCAATTSATCAAEHPNCTWTPAGTSTKTRTVTCRKSTGVAVNESYCTGTRPPASAPCDATTSSNSSSSSSNSSSSSSSGSASSAPVDGVCGSANGRSYSRASFISRPDRCDVSATVPGVVTEESLFKRTCKGMHGGSDASCTAIKLSPIA